MAFIKLALPAIFFLSSFYNINIKTSDGTEINLNDYKGKKVLFVNTATNSQMVDQFQRLEQLYQSYKDSLIIVACPSNSFGNEPLNNEEIKRFIQSRYNVHFIVAEKMNVLSDDSISPLYNWLTLEDQNQQMSNEVKMDFYKFLVNEEGGLVGVFDGTVDPMDKSILDVLGN